MLRLPNHLRDLAVDGHHVAHTQPVHDKRLALEIDVDTELVRVSVSRKSSKTAQKRL